MKENEAIQNLGYAGYLFKKTLQPHSLRNDHFKQATEFKEKNIVLYINQKFNEIRKRMGTDTLPKSIFLQSMLQTKSTKTDIHKILAQDNIEQRQELLKKSNIYLNKNKELMKMKRYEPTMNSIYRYIMRKLEDRKPKEYFVFESEGAPIKKNPKKLDNGNPDRKVRAILHERIGENELKDSLSHFNKLRLKTKFQRLKNDKNFEKIDFNKKFMVINQIIQNEDDPIDNYYFMTEVCQKNNIDLSQIMHVDPEKLKMLEEPFNFNDFNKETDSDGSILNTSLKKKKSNPSSHIKFHRRLSVSEIESIIQKEEDNQAKNLINIFKKTHEEPDEYKQKITSTATATNKKVNFQDQLFQKLEDTHKHEVLKILKKKNEFNEQKFIRTTKSFQSSKKIDQLLYLDKLATPKPYKSNHRRISTIPNLASPINSAALPDFLNFNKTPQTEKNNQEIQKKQHIKSVSQTFNLMKPPQSTQNFSTKPRLSTFDEISKDSLRNFQSRPLTTKFNPNVKIGDLNNANFINKRPQSCKNQINNPKARFSMSLASKAKIPKELTKNRLSMLEMPKNINLEEIKANLPKAPRVSIFETYKDPNKLENKDTIEKDRNQKKIQYLMLRKKEKRKMIGKFNKFFQECDMEALLQTDETKNLNEEFKRFGREYEKMQYNANKNIERFNLFSSDNNFNQLRTQVKFKKKLIDHLLERINDKQDLLSMYNKFVMMEENINKSKKMLKE